MSTRGDMMVKLALKKKTDNVHVHSKNLDGPKLIPVDRVSMKGDHLTMPQTTESETSPNTADSGSMEGNYGTWQQSSPKQRFPVDRLICEGGDRLLSETTNPAPDEIVIEFIGCEEKDVQADPAMNRFFDADDLFDDKSEENASINFLSNQLGPEVLFENMMEKTPQKNNIEVVAMEFDVGNVEMEVEINNEAETVIQVDNNYEDDSQEKSNDIDYVPDNDEEKSSSSGTDREHDAQTPDSEPILNQSKEINPKRKRSRRGRALKDNWEQRKNQIKRSKGEEYFGRRKNEEGKTVFDVKKGAKQIKVRCLCKDIPKTQFKCSTISDEERIKIFEKFWSLTRGEKKIFVQGLVQRKSVLRRKEDKATFKRNQSLFYYLDTNNMKGKVRVCKKMFLHTLSVGEWAVLNWVKSSRPIEQCLGDNEDEVKDKEQDPINTRKSQTDRAKKIIVKSFFESLPKLESHYCRRDSSKLYLEPKWQSKAELYRLYESFCNSQGKENQKASICLFYEIFDECNLSLFQPKKDQCDVCCAFHVGNLSEQAYKTHVDYKERARKEKDKDKAHADNPDSKTAVFTMDMQAVLLSPDLKASALYYRTKLKVHNFTIFNLNTLDGYCYLWDESEGGLNADEFASILYDFITKQIDKNTYNHVIFYSDGCTYQNRNCVVANTLLLAAQETGIEITQKFLEKGHTQMECDSMHATIERKLRNREVRYTLLQPTKMLVEQQDYFQNLTRCSTCTMTSSKSSAP